MPEDQEDVVACAAQDGVHGTANLAFEIVAPEQAVVFQVVNDRFKGKTRPSRIPPPTHKVQEVLALTLTGKPVAATQWSCRTMAQQVGISRMAVHGIWREHKLKPHQVRGFKVSNDPLFAEKLRDVVGLYLDPPEGHRIFRRREKPNSGTGP